ncbi:pyridoxamine 5'-phosphate oxidase [Fimicolochytrium jonesii]|uniref:pyridoxamine 5'-phosphate oxidase n=1 Tax=Fimicolochytrium jonesii TaxID=1396493 RepID=UPI0022FEEA1C|nr:pyridoxamine 5'-phosphate oxidase [Fimicolochytrium jonesii]KAI8816998.1 pyridoxamine 5'-phosphate oxidase [Fimicolochytrium jonesii]
MRITYNQHTLLDTQILPSPFSQFESWFNDAKRDALTTSVEPNAMNLATSTRDGRPSSRMVLLKDYDEDGFVFFTNYESRKGRELSENPWAALNFWWGQRSVRVEGRAEKVDAAESDEYYNSRPRGSRIGAWTSPQSCALQGREELESLEREVEKRFEGVEEIPRPPFWGGFRVVPERIEFWQGRPSRLHDRIEFRRTEGGKRWKMARLAP